MNNITINISLPEVSSAKDNTKVNKIIIKDLAEKKKRRGKRDTFLGASEFESPESLKAENYIK